MGNIGKAVSTAKTAAQIGLAIHGGANAHSQPNHLNAPQVANTNISNVRNASGNSSRQGTSNKGNSNRSSGGGKK